MNLNELNVNIWNHLDEGGDVASGYVALFLNKDDKQESRILIFKDENKKPHFVVADTETRKEDLFNPHVRGLNINLKKFKFRGREIEQFIDLEIGSEAYIEEFTEIVKEISSRILIKNDRPMAAVKAVVSIWKSFWGMEKTDILSEEAQIGLICELNVLKKLCIFSDPENALNSWRGPFKEKYDFLFSNWAFEVKGTQKEGHIHIINGIGQLSPPHGKKLAFISFLVTKADNVNSKSVASWIRDFEYDVFRDKINLSEQFNDLLVRYGYNRVNSLEYENMKYDIYDGRIYLVNKSFPKVILESLKRSLDRRISELRYTINLDDVYGNSFEKTSLGKFYK